MNTFGEEGGYRSPVHVGHVQIIGLFGKLIVTPKLKITISPQRLELSQQNLAG